MKYNCMYALFAGGDGVGTGAVNGTPCVGIVDMGAWPTLVTTEA